MYFCFKGIGTFIKVIENLIESTEYFIDSTEICQKLQVQL